MKKAIINYSKSIWFKLTEDKMTRNEALFLGFLLCGITLTVLHLSGVDLRR